MDGISSWNHFMFKNASSIQRTAEHFVHMLLEQMHEAHV